MADGTPEEMRHFVDDCRPAVVFATRNRWEALQGLIHVGPRRVVLTDGEPLTHTAVVETLSELEGQGQGLGLEPVPTGETEPMAIMYTSGSTSRPKGVILDAASFIKDAAIQPQRFHLADGENVLGVMALYHIAGWHQSLAIALGVRGGLMMQRRFSAGRFWADVDRSGAVGGLLMPAMVSILRARPTRPDDATHPLRIVLSHWTDPEFERRFGLEIVPVWGQTELGGLVTSGCAGEPMPSRECVGWPLPDTELQIRDEDGRPAARGTIGEIFVRSPWVMKGYWGDPELTGSVLRDGWIRTGDAGCLDGEGRLLYAGRLKGMIKRGGENISAREVESVLATHPDVNECACFAVPDPIRTEEVKVVLVPRPGTSPDFPALVEHCRGRLADFKIPRYWEERSQMPRTASMKVALRELAAEHARAPGWDRTADRELTHAAPGGPSAPEPEPGAPPSRPVRV